MPISLGDAVPRVDPIDGGRQPGRFDGHLGSTYDTGTYSVSHGMDGRIRVLVMVVSGPGCHRVHVYEADGEDWFENPFPVPSKKAIEKSSRFWGGPGGGGGMWLPWGWGWAY